MTGYSRRLLFAFIIALVWTSSGCISLIEKTYHGPNNIKLTMTRAPLPDDAFRARLEFPFPLPDKLRTGERIAVHIVVTNVSSQTWPSAANREGKYRIDFGNHWLDEAGNMVIVDDGRGLLPYDLEPGKSSEVLLVITAPAKPGKYTLEIDVVQEMVSWFADKGSQTLRLQVAVV